MISQLIGYSNFFGSQSVCDGIDSLSAIITTNALVIFSLIISFKQFGGRPIECLVPDRFVSAWEQYAENYCWAQDTYYVPLKTLNVATMTKEERMEKRISYYQWVPFFLLIEAACFRLPSLLWKYMAEHSGIKIHEIVKLAADKNNLKPAIKQGNIQDLTVHLQGALGFHRRLRRKEILPHKFIRFFNLPYSSFFVSTIYLVTKFVYLVNICAQLFLMNNFLETDKYTWYGFGAMADLLNGTTWEQTGLFPRVSLCDFEVRVMGNVQPHTIQCVLVINIFNEKIFIFLWFWYVVLLLFTAGSFIYWFFVIVLPQPSRRFIIRHLEMSNMPFDYDASKKDVNRFITGYLKSDGLFVIRMITMNSGVIFGTELVHNLWKSFYNIELEYRKSVSNLADHTWPLGDEEAPDPRGMLRLRRRRKSIDEPTTKLNSLLHLGVPPVPPKPSAPVNGDMTLAGIEMDSINESQPFVSTRQY